MCCFFLQVFLTYWCFQRFNLLLDRLASAAVVIQRGTYNLVDMQARVQLSEMNYVLKRGRF